MSGWGVVPPGQPILDDASEPLLDDAGQIITEDNWWTVVPPSTPS